MLVLLFVALWFILRGDLFYVLTLCYFVLVFFSPFSIAITSLGKERANLSAFRTFVRFVLVWFYRFPLPLGVWKGLRFVIVALPGLFSYLFTILACLQPLRPITVRLRQFCAINTSKSSVTNVNPDTSSISKLWHDVITSCRKS